MEEITRKTGNYKRFPVLVEMLLSALKKVGEGQRGALDAEGRYVKPHAILAPWPALEQNNPTVSLDVMTVEDLSAVKHANPMRTEVPLDSKQEKLYLILTYAVAYDR